MSDEKKTTASSSSPSSSTAAAASATPPKKVRITRPCSSAGGDQVPKFAFHRKDLNRVLEVGTGEDKVDPRVAAVLIEKKAAVAAG